MRVITSLRALGVVWEVGVVWGFARKFSVLGRCSVRVGCCVSQVAVIMACRKLIVRACGGINDDVAIDYSLL